jgi:hypothetical protein
MWLVERELGRRGIMTREVDAETAADVNHESCDPRQFAPSGRLVRRTSSCVPIVATAESLETMQRRRRPIFLDLDKLTGQY